VSRTVEPLGPAQWRWDAIGAFSGVVNEGRTGVVPFAGPSPLIVEDPTSLPPAGTEVSFVVVAGFRHRGSRTQKLYARSVRSAR
jgi:hypothetical protein